MQGLRHWSYLLKNTPEKSPVLVYMNHANLQYYQDPKKLPAQVYSWNAERADYNIKFIYKPRVHNHADGLFRRSDHAAGLEENHDVTTFSKELFSLDNDQYRIWMAGWIGVTGEDILHSQGLEIPNSTELEHLIIKFQIENRSTLDQWHTAHSLEEWSSCF